MNHESNRSETESRSGQDKEAEAEEAREVMKSGFQTPLNVRLREDSDCIWVVASPLKYFSESLNLLIVVPPWFESESPDPEQSCFETDFASVPRVPIVYNAWGDRAHREAVLHDYLYRIDSVPVVEKSQADKVFLEAMQSTGKPWYISRFMYWGVCVGGGSSYHKKNVRDRL